MGGWIYMLTNKPNGILYTGVTADLARRVWEHREALVDGFSKRYGLKRLVYAEQHATIQEAIAHEKHIKEWKRAWKVKRILETNPNWDDLYETIL